MTFLPRRLKRLTAAAALGLSLLTYAAPARAQDARPQIKHVVSAASYNHASAEDYLGAAAAPQINAVLNAASFTADIGQGSLASAFGTDFVAAEKVNPEDRACRPTWNDPTRPFTFPTTLCGVAVEADGQRLPLTYVGKQNGYDQVNFQAPFDVNTRKIKIIRDGIESNTVAVALKDKAPGVFTWGNHFAVAQNADYRLIHPANPVRIPTDANNISADSWVAFYMQGLGKPTNTAAPAMGALYGAVPLATLEKPSVYIDGERLPDDHVVNASGAPGLIIQQLNWRPAIGTSPGAKSVKVCAGDVCTPAVNVSMTDGDHYAYGTITSPGTMSDGTHALEAIIVRAGDRTSRVDPYGNYLIPAQGTVDLTFEGNGAWENYRDTIKAEGTTAVSPIKGFPRVTYTDAKGNYDRDTRTWTNVGYLYHATGEWRGATDGGEVKLLDMVQFMAVNAVHPACKEAIRSWDATNKPIKVFLDTMDQPYFDPSTTGRIQGSAPANALSGTEVLWKTLSESQSLGGPAFQRVDYNPIAAGEPGITFKFSDALPSGITGSTYALPHRHESCDPIISAEVRISPLVYSTSTVAAVGRHEFLGRATGYGTSGTSPFAENMGTSSGPDSARDRDGRKMVEFLGHGVDLGKYGR